MSLAPRVYLCTLLIATLFAGCDQPPPTAEVVDPATPSSGPACDEVGGVSPVCGFRNPEDLAVVPGGKFLVVSEMAPFMSDAPSTLSLLISL